jgi:hypothetical protein
MRDFHVNGGPTPVKAPTGHHIARRAGKLDASHKALLVAGIKAGVILESDIRLGDLTIGQLCKIVGVSRPYGYAAAAMNPDEWTRVHRGVLKISDKLTAPSDQKLDRLVAKHAARVMAAVDRYTQPRMI